MDKENLVLCGANSYVRKYYLNEKFSNLPEGIKQELQILCVTFTEEVGGILTLEYDKDGNLMLITVAEENDLLYDDIGSGLKVHQIQRERKELLEALEMYYKVFIEGKEV